MTDNLNPSLNNNIDNTTSTVVNILVIGDVMIDRYWFGVPKELADEASVAVLAINSAEDRAGGAANVALNIKKLGGEVAILAPLGQDADGVILTDMMRREGITQYWQYGNSATIVKHRMLSKKQQLLRVDFEQKYCPLELTQDVKNIIATHKVIIFSDYDKGSLENCQKIIAYARSLGLIVLVDPKGANFSRYQSATMLTPNYKEFVGEVGQVEMQETASFHKKAFNLLKKLELDYLLVTCGADGMVLFGPENFVYSARSYANQVYDVTGAGDTVLASLAVSLCKNEDKSYAIERASHAAAVVVSQVGTGFATKEEVDNQIARHYSETEENYHIKGFSDSNDRVIYIWPEDCSLLTTKEIEEMLLLKQNNPKARLTVRLSQKKTTQYQALHTKEQLLYMISKISLVDEVEFCV